MILMVTYSKFLFPLVWVDDYFALSFASFSPRMLLPYLIFCFWDRIKTMMKLLKILGGNFMECEGMFVNFVFWVMLCQCHFDMRYYLIDKLLQPGNFIECNNAFLSDCFKIIHDMGQFSIWLAYPLQTLLVRFNDPFLHLIPLTVFCLVHLKNNKGLAQRPVVALACALPCTEASC